MPSCTDSGLLKSRTHGLKQDFQLSNWENLTLGWLLHPGHAPGRTNLFLDPQISSHQRGLFHVQGNSVMSFELLGL